MVPDVVSKDALLARLGGDAALLGAMAALFLEEYPRYLAGIRDAVVRHDARELERTAHGLKGSVSNFMASESAQAAQALETMGRAGSLAHAEQALAELEAALGRLRPVLESFR